MSYRIDIECAAAKFLGKLGLAQPKHAEALENAIEDLGEQPRPAGCLPLTGHPGVLRIRVGDYRICYTVEDGRLVVLIIVISTRDNVYDAVKRYLAR